MQVPPFSLSEQLKELGDNLDQAVLEVLRGGQYIGGPAIGDRRVMFLLTLMMVAMMMMTMMMMIDERIVDRIYDGYISL